jgi:hypothetical protein
MEEWENMLHFAVIMLETEVSAHNVNDSLNQRIAIVHLHHVTELLMKSFLLKEGYLINEVDYNKVKLGIRNNSKLKEFINPDRTIGFQEALGIIAGKVNLDKAHKERILNLNRVRNEIQHRGLAIPHRKPQGVNFFRTALKDLYSKMFPTYYDAFPDF